MRQSRPDYGRAFQVQVRLAPPGDAEPSRGARKGGGGLGGGSVKVRIWGLGFGVWGFRVQGVRGDVDRVEGLGLLIGVGVRTLVTLWEVGPLP